MFEMIYALRPCLALPAHVCKSITAPLRLLVKHLSYHISAIISAISLTEGAASTTLLQDSKTFQHTHMSGTLIWLLALYTQAPTASSQQPAQLPVALRFWIQSAQLLAALRVCMQA
jgi:hypothetical protein